MSRHSDKKQQRQEAQRLRAELIAGQVADAAGARRLRAEYERNLASDWDKGAWRAGIAQQNRRLDDAAYNLKGMGLDTDGNKLKKKWWQ